MIDLIIFVVLACASYCFGVPMQTFLLACILVMVYTKGMVLDQRLWSINDKLRRLELYLYGASADDDEIFEKDSWLDEACRERGGKRRL